MVICVHRSWCKKSVDGSLTAFTSLTAYSIFNNYFTIFVTVLLLSISWDISLADICGITFKCLIVLDRVSIASDKQVSALRDYLIRTTLWSRCVSLEVSSQLLILLRTTKNSSRLFVFYVGLLRIYDVLVNSGTSSWSLVAKTSGSKTIKILL